MSGRRAVFEVYNDDEMDMPNVTRRQPRGPVGVRRRLAVTASPVAPPVFMPFVTRRSKDRIARMEREQAKLAAEQKKLRIEFKRLLASIKTYSPKR